GKTASVKLLWDAEYLYAAFSVPDSNIIAPVMERDGPVWENDCIELFLLPSLRYQLYWEINISPTGSILDSLSYKYSDRWGDEMRFRENVQGLKIGRTVRGAPNDTSDGDEGYTIEVAVPF